MSELTVGQLRGLPVNNNIVTVPSGHELFAPGHVIQVVHASTTTQVSTTGSTFIDSGLTATITPKSASSRILVLFNQNGVIRNNDGAVSSINLRMVLPNASTVNYGTQYFYTGSAIFFVSGISGQAVYTSGNTSAQTFKTQFANAEAGLIARVQNSNERSTMTLMEIAQ
jgi:hypothetical protein